jgi:hypothetical protein
MPANLRSLGTTGVLNCIYFDNNDFPNSSSIHNAVQSYQQPSQSPTTTPTTKFDTNGIRASEGIQPAQHPATWRPPPWNVPGPTTTTNPAAGIHGKYY